MTLWLMILMVFLGGVLGGTVNAILSDNGFVSPMPRSISEK
jgi:hypothetical protein